MNSFTENEQNTVVQSPCLAELYNHNPFLFLRRSWYDGWYSRATQEVNIGPLRLVILALSALLRKDRGQWVQRKKLIKILKIGESLRLGLNESVTKQILERYAELFDKVEEHPLTEAQRLAVACDEDANLVIAGAGTGKTSTIVAKIGLLLQSGQCKPSEILAISFTRKSAMDLAERVKKKLRVELDVFTFHKLGLDIVSKCEGAKPALAAFVEDPALRSKHVHNIIFQLQKNKQFSNDLSSFWAYFRLPLKQDWDFGSMAEYANWLRSNNLVSLDGFQKKSYEECVIANWLILNGVEFEYERPYEHSTRTVDYRQYRPDFYLTKYGLYVEHFGVDKSGNTAPYIDSIKYGKEMEWKRKVHKTNNTSMIETYSWQFVRGELIDRLSAQLVSKGVELSPVSEAEALQRLNMAGYTTELANLVLSFLTLYKGNGNRLNRGGHNSNSYSRLRDDAFLKVLQPVMDEYERQNAAVGEIDYEDMITRATKYVQENRFDMPYKYILVDEFQDISNGRAELLSALHRSSENVALFCVGDDWQSIYRFAGSDIGAMTRFQNYFGYSGIVKLDVTFRFDSRLADTSSRFVLKNPIQMQKVISSNRSGAESSVILYSLDKIEPRWDWCLKRIEALTREQSTVLILERYKKNLPTREILSQLTRRHPNLIITASTVHAAKGLEADYSIVGLQGGSQGFPSTRVDDPVLNMVLTQPDEYSYGEERRLFYVAMTRSRKKTFVISDVSRGKSAFAAELESEAEYGIELHGVDQTMQKCDKCGSGTMSVKQGKNGSFYACSNYPLCTNTSNSIRSSSVGVCR